MKFDKDVVIKACNIALESVKRSRDKEWDIEINRILNGFFIRRIFKIKTREDAIKYIENQRANDVWSYTNLETGWGTEADAENILRMCKHSCGKEIDLGDKNASFVSSWLS